jgi:carbon monoxide dehydrogenase subunit G
MSIEIRKSIVVKAAPADVWRFITDPERVAFCLPGANIDSKVDDKTFTGTMHLKIGPVHSAYHGRVVYEKRDMATGETEIVATAQEKSGKGHADLHLSSKVRRVAASITEVTAISTLNVHGVLANMGHDLIEDMGDQMFAAFEERMRAQLEAPDEEARLAEVAAAAAPKGHKPKPKPEAHPAELNLGSIAGKAAGHVTMRVLNSYGFWLGLIGIALALYLLAN